MTLTRKARHLSYLAMTVTATATLATATLATPVTALATAAHPTAAHPTAAHPTTANAIAGYVWADGGNAEDYYDFNTANSHSGSVTVSAINPGVYQVEFANMAGIAGNLAVQVTPYSVNEHCGPSGWGLDGTSLRIVVDCYLGGTLTDGNFNLIVTHPTSPPHGVFDYSLVHKSNSSGTLTADQYNSSHKKNSVKHLGPGRYQLLFPGPKSTGTQGIVHVTPYGAQPGDCELVGWTGSAKGELVNVDCFDAAHHAQNREFIVTYATSSSLMGLNGQFVANAFANSKAPLYVPRVQFDSKRGAQVSIVHFRTGSYEALPVGSAGNSDKWGGDVQVSAVGTRNQHCISDGWGTGITPSLNVECFDKFGNLADVPFTVEWVVP